MKSGKIVFSHIQQLLSLILVFSTCRDSLLLPVPDKGVLYPVATILVNTSNSFDKKEVEPEMLELAKFAQHHVPEEHEKVGLSGRILSTYFVVCASTIDLQTVRICVSYWC